MVTAPRNVFGINVLGKRPWKLQRVSQHLAAVGWPTTCYSVSRCDGGSVDGVASHVVVWFAENREGGMWMTSGRIHRPSLTFVIIMFVISAMLLHGSTLFADDFETPQSPLPPREGGSGGSFGGLRVKSPEVAGPAIDAKEAIEPQLTALLTMGEVDDWSSQTVHVSMYPTFCNWTE